jgi:phage host-nuclease inhibitor protein Gam
MKIEIKDLIKFIDDWCNDHSKVLTRGQHKSADDLRGAIKDRFQQEDYQPVPSYIKHGVNFLNSQMVKKEQDEK